MKSKIEQICEDFEQSSNGSEVDLGSYHPMNIASVVKLYLRKLPEPLLTHELYDEWIAFAEVSFFFWLFNKNLKLERLKHLIFDFSTKVSVWKIEGFNI